MSCMGCCQSRRTGQGLHGESEERRQAEAHQDQQQTEAQKSTWRRVALLRCRPRMLECFLQPGMERALKSALRESFVSCRLLCCSTAQMGFRLSSSMCEAS